MEILPGLLLLAFVVAGYVLVGLSARYRFASPKTMSETSSDQRRFWFFIAWTLLLPLVWLVEWYGYYGAYNNWQHMPTVLPEFTYGRKVISDMWTAVAAVLGLLAWNKKP